MATEIVLKHFQIFRNETIGSYSTYANALTAAKGYWTPDFVTTKGLKAGEFVLFNYKLTGSEKVVESILGIVREGAIDIIGSYDQLTTEYKAYVDSAIKDLDGSATIATVAEGVVTLKAGIAETDGIIANSTATDITLAKVATTGTAADVAVATGIEGLTATTVQGALAELQGDIKGLQAIDPVVTTVAAGTGISVTSATTEGGNDVTYTVTADFTVDTIKYGDDAGVNKAGKTYIRIMDGDTVISETDAAAFVKDGFLQSVTKDEENNTIKFTWNTDAGVQETTISIKELCDVYTVGEGLVASEDGYTFSHQDGATGLPTTAVGSGSATANKITVNVPSVTVDKFGHVSALTGTEVSLEIPASVAEAVQTVNGDTYVTATKSGTTVTLATKTQSVEGATAAEGETPAVDGLATALDVKTYVDEKIGTVNTAIANLDAAVTSTDGKNVQVKVTEVDGVITAVNVTTDNTINATDLSNAINALDADVTNIETLEGAATTSDIKVSISEVDGKLTSVTVTDTLKQVAHTGKAADVTIADTDGVIAATNVEGALVEIAKEIDAMDLTATDVVALNGDKNALQAGKIKEEDGKVTVETAATLVEFNQAISSTNKVATMADITDAAISGNEAIKVEDKVVSLVIDGADQVLTQGTNGLLANVALSYGEETDGKKYIKLTGKNGANLGKIDASDFIKDGFLVSVTEDTDNNTLTFTWNTDAGVTETTIAIKDLCDVYTADETYLLLNGYKFKHKTITGLDSKNTHGLTADVSVTDTNTTTFQVPSLKVDAAGHVVSVDEKTVTITLPASINTAVQTVISNETVNTTDKFVAVNATRAENSNEVVLTTEYKTQAIKTAAEGTDGLATALDVKSYVDTKVGEANTAAIEALDATVTDSNDKNDITVKVTQTDGILTAIEVTDSLKNVAHTGAAADVTYTRGSGDSATNMTVQEAISALEAVDTWDAGTY